MSSDDMSSSSSTSDSDADSDSREKKKKKKKAKKIRKQAKKNKKKEKQHRRDGLTAGRLQNKIAPIVRQLRSHQERITAEVRECLPPYQTLDLGQHLNIVNELEQQISLVVKGHSTIAREKLDGEDVLTKISKAKTASSAFLCTLIGAEGVVAKRQESRKKAKKSKS
jgi:hypothetical protein